MAMPMQAQCKPTHISQTPMTDLFPCAGGQIDFERFCQEHAVETYHTLRLAWGIVLRTYSAESHVSFKHIMERLGGNDDNKEQPLSVTLHLPEDSTVHGLLLQVARGTQTWQGDDEVTSGKLNILGYGPNTLITQRRNRQKSDPDASLGDDEDCGIALIVQTDGDHSCVCLRYPQSILTESHASRIEQSFRHALAVIQKHPSWSLRDLDLCSPEDRTQIALWNPPPPPASQSCVHDLITGQAEQDPDSPAISAWDGGFTYQELDRLSSNVAAYLRLAGVKPETFVPLSFEKSKWAAVALLGVLKAGGAYVFLDPSFPNARLSSICNDLSATLLLTSDKTASVGEGLATNVVKISEACTSPRATAKQPHEPTRTQPQNALYGVFTSGSTGKPKGVTMEHAAFVSAALANGPALKLDRSSRVLQFSNYTYDVSNRDVLMTLIFGGCVCVPSDRERLEDLPAFLSRHQVNWASITPSTAELLEPDQVPSLRHLVLAGEPMRPSQISKWSERVVLMNSYGPCEVAASSSSRIVEQNSSHANIGRGAGTRLWVVAPTDHNKLVPVGAIGELIIEGPSVGRGYINHDGSNSPFLSSTTWQREIRQENQCRLYKTGDLGYYNSDGSITFAGRADTQVKVRGQRVELAEVEHHVQQHLLSDGPNINAGSSTSVVAEVATPKEGGNSILLAFIDIGEEASGSTDSVRVALGARIAGIEQRLAGKLPTYMIPTAYIALPGIPMTMSGKINRRHLRKVVESSTLQQLIATQPTSSVKQPPETDMEMQVQQMWASVLGIAADSIGRADSFFRTGGDSIGAIRLVAAARERGLLLTVANIFLHPQLSEQAQHVDTMNRDDLTIEPFSLLPSGALASDVCASLAAQCGISLFDIEDAFPCTPLQEGLMAVTASRPGQYVGKFVLELSPSIDLKRLQRAWERVLEQDAKIMRTRIVDVPGVGLLQTIISQKPEWPPLRPVDVCLRQHEELKMGLDTPLAQICIAQEGAKKLFVLTIHHALYDGFTTPLLLDYVTKAYHGSEVGVSAPFQAFIKHVRNERPDREGYWRAQLDNSEAPVFPSLPSPNYQPHADEEMERRVPNIQWPRTEITSATILRAAWSIVAACYTQSGVVVFGALLSGRQAPVPGVDRMVGPTIATVPVRVDVATDANVHELLQQVQSQALSMLPFEQTGLQYIRRISPSAEQSCRFQTLLVLQPPSPKAFSDDEHHIFLQKQDDDTVQKLDTFNTYALMISCQLAPNGVQLRFSFDSHLIERVQVSLIARQMESVIRRLCQAGPQTTVATVMSAGKDDTDDIWKWNMTAPEMVHRCIHDLIAERVCQSPQSPAVCAWDGNLTYNQLDELSTCLAFQLLDHGVGPGVVVPLCFEKSKFMPIAMLGVMKSGGASVAMDMDLPEDRLHSIVQQVQPRVLLSSPLNRSIVARLSDQTILLVDRTDPADLPPPKRALPSVSPSNMAYVVFTSGTTGTPKGAIITHENFSSAIAYQQEKYGFHPAARIFDFASYAFDAAWANFLHSASSGACLCIPSNDDRKNDLQGVMIRMAVTYADLTPSAARLLDPAALPNLTILVLAGEAMAPQDLSRWYKGRTLFNAYGPAEASVSATISDPLSPSSQAANVGRGYGSVTWIMDSSGTQLVPISAAGELWLEGPIVGAGYLGDHDKTALSFVDDPQWLLQGAPGRPGRRGRLYRTGDLVKYNPDGTLMFIGRKDAQVKIRGQRVELGDIEHHVQQNFPEASDIVAEVVSPAGADQVPLLVAFVHYERGSDLPDTTDGDLLMHPSERFSSFAANAESRLQDAVPIYMIPAFFLPIQTVPTATTGKADRRLLRKMVESMDLTTLRSYGHLDAKKLAPSTDMERTLQTLWAQTLNLDPTTIGTTDNFFKLGGDSITAMQLTGKCRTKGIQVSVAQIFREKSIQGLALVAATVEDSAVAVNQQLEVQFELSPIQKWFFETQPREVNQFTQSFLLHMSRKLPCIEVARAVESIVERHSMLRARFPVATDGTSMQLLQASVAGSYVFEDLQVDTLEAAKGRINNTRTALDIRKGPLFAVVLVDVRDEDQYLFLVAHHLVIDLVSWRVLLEDLEQLLTMGGVSSLPSLPFQPWCQLQARYSENHLTPERALPFEVIEPSLEYWGREAARNTYGDTKTHEFTINKATSDQVLGSANEAYDTQVVEIFQAAIWHSFQSTFLDRLAPAIWSEGHGRESWDDTVDVSRTVGWFTTMWPTVLPGSGPFTLSETVRRTKDCRRQVPKNGWAYFNSRYLNPEGKKAFQSHGAVEVLFNYEGAYQQLERQDGLFHRVQDAIGSSAEVKRDLQRSALVEISVSLVQGCIRYTFEYNKYMDHQESISKWIDGCRRSLESAATDLTGLKHRHTLSDFPLLRTNYEGLDELLEQTLPQNNLSLGNLEDIYPCLPLQNFMLECHKSCNRMYATASVGRLHMGSEDAPCNLVALKDAWQTVVNRHAALRTVFVAGKGDCVWTQIVKRHVIAPVLELDGGQHDPLNTLNTLPSLTVDSTNVPHRLTICLTPTGEALFRLDTSHAIMDAISHTVVFNQWFAAYGGQSPTQVGAVFREHVKHVLSSTPAETNYWIEYLENAWPCLLPVSSTTSENDRGRPGTVSLPWGDSSSLRAYAQKHSVTVSTLIKSAWLLTLHSFTGTRHVCFGYLESGRDVPIMGIEHTVGALLSTLVCKIEIDDDSFVRDILDTVQEDYRRSMPYQSGGALAAMNELKLSPPSTRLFNSLVNYRKEQQVSKSRDSSTDIRVESLYGEDGMEADIVLTVDDHGSDVIMGIEYWDGRCTVEHIRHVVAAFKATLATMLENSDQLVREVRPEMYAPGDH